MTTRATMVANSIAFVSWDSQISVWCKIDQTITGPEDHRTEYHRSRIRTAWEFMVLVVFAQPISTNSLVGARQVSLMCIAFS